MKLRHLTQFANLNYWYFHEVIRIEVLRSSQKFASNHRIKLFSIKRHRCFSTLLASCNTYYTFANAMKTPTLKILTTALALDPCIKTSVQGFSKTFWGTRANFSTRTSNMIENSPCLFVASAKFLLEDYFVFFREYFYESNYFVHFCDKKPFIF